MARIVLTVSGWRIRRTMILVTSAMVPSEPVSRPGEVVARLIGGHAAGVDDGAIGQHGFEAEDVVGGDAVAEGVRAAGVFGDVAADGAGALAGGIGREEVTRRLGRLE